MPVGITLADALEVFGGELGSGGDRKLLLDEVTTSIEYLMFNGGGEILREWVVPIIDDNRVVLPRDLLTPVKWKFGTLPHSNLGFGVFNSPYYSYSSHAVERASLGDYYAWNPRFSLSVNNVSTQFCLPAGGAHILATTRDERDVGKSLLVSGYSGDKLVAPIHNGFKTAGELLTIYMEDDPDKKYSSFKFTKITQVVKDETCNYVLLSGNKDPFRGKHSPYHLAFYHPDETVPLYKEIQMSNVPVISGGQYVSLHILGRVDPSIRYIRDEEVLPINSRLLLKYLAKRARYLNTGNFNEQNAIEGMIQQQIKQTVAYQQAPGRSMSIQLRGSGATLKNI